MNRATQYQTRFSLLDWDPTDLTLYLAWHDIRPSKTTFGDTFKKVTDPTNNKKLITLNKDVIHDGLLQSGYKDPQLRRLFLMSTPVQSELSNRVCLDYFVINGSNQREFLHLLLKKK